MAGVQIEPAGAGAGGWVPVTGPAKPPLITEGVPGYALNIMEHAVNLYRICGGQPGATRDRADKMAAAVGQSLRWA
jgi:hypothetical protein